MSWTHCILLFLLEEISDLDEEFYIGWSRWRGSFFFLRHGSIHSLHHEEYTDRYDDEVDSDSDEVAPCDHSSDLLGICECTDDDRIPEIVVHIREIESTCDLADDWHDDILDNRGDDLAERCTDDHTDCEIDYIALHREVSELFYHTHRK